MKHKRPYKLFSFIFFWILIGFVCLNLEVSISYNQSRAKERAKNIWEKGLVVVQYLGSIKKAVF